MNRPDTVPRQEKIGASWVALVLALVTIAIYAQAGGFSFVNYDDPDYVVENRMVNRGWSYSGVQEAFFKSHAANWHPVTWLSHMTDVQLWGLAPGPHHLVNVFWHMLNALLLFYLLRRMTGATWKSALVAALFAWHPLHVESVAWISERKDLLSTFFGLLAMISYVRWSRTANRAYFHGALLAGALALMSKPMLVTLPFLLLLLDYWPLNRLSGETPNSFGRALRKCLAEKWLFFVMTLAVCVITVVSQKAGGAVASSDAVPLGLRLRNIPMAYVAYLGKMFWPVDLSPFYPFAKSIPLIKTMLAALLLVGVSIWVVVRRRTHPHRLVGWFWFLGTLVPVIGLAQVGMQSMADRYTYLPLVGIFIAMAWEIERWRLRHCVSIAVVPLLVALAFLSWRQAAFWKDSETLFAHALRIDPANPVALINLGAAREKSGEGQFLESYEKAAEAAPGSSLAQFNLGHAYELRGDLGRAEQHYRQAIILSPASPGPRYNLAIVLDRANRLEEAIAELEALLKRVPGHARAHNNLGGLLLKQGKTAEARAEFLQAIKTDPALADAYYNLGSLDLAQGKIAEAGKSLSQALSLDPGHAAARNTLAQVLVMSGKVEDAIAQLQESLRLNGSQPETRAMLGTLFIARGKTGEAVAELQRAARELPNAASVQFALGMALLANHSAAEGVAALREAVRLQPSNPEWPNALAWVLATHPDGAIRDGAEALRLAERADELTQHRDFRVLATMAAAHAESGQFEQAVTIGGKAFELAPTQGRAGIEQALDGYRNRRPLRRHP